MSGNIVRKQARRSYTKALYLGLMLAVASAWGFAQLAGEAALMVIVVDSNGATILSAQVGLKGAGGFQQTILTNQQGMATFQKLPLGRYFRAFSTHFANSIAPAWQCFGSVKPERGRDTIVAS